MKTHPLCSLVVAAGLAVAGEASAAPAFVDGPVSPTPAVCVINGNSVTGAETKVGYVVDPVAELPQLGQVTYIHAVATNRNPCGADVVGFDFYLPTGARWAIDATNPVKCFIGNGSTGGPAPMCLQTPTTGPFGGAFFGSQSGLAPNWAFEIQVPVIFDQPIAGNTIDVFTTSVWGATYAGVGVNAPFQPPLNWYAHGDDLALLGAIGAGATLPMAFSNDDGSFTVTNYPVGDFAAWSRQPGVQRLTGDFNGDGLTDYALTGGAGWSALPVALAIGDGRFTITNTNVGWFGAWASENHVTALAADFNHDGHTDIALTGGIGWNAIPIAFSTGNGNFNVTNVTNISNFAGWAATAGAKPQVGDFNHDGFADIALTGVASWTTLPVAFSYGNGSFLITNNGVGVSWWGGGWNFAMKSGESGVQTVVGDFNKDGFSDIALTGGASSSSIFVAMSYGNGSFLLVDSPATNFAGWAKTPGAKLLSGDFNKDGYTDLALTGAAGWNTIPVAMSAGSGNFNVSNNFVGAFGSWTSTPGTRVVTGDYNGDGFTDIAVTGGAGWASIPVAFSAGWGTFNVANQVTHRFPGWAMDTTAKVISGRGN